MKVNRDKMLKTVSSNKNIVISAVVFICIFSILVVPFVNKGTHSADTEIGVVSLNCPNSVSKNSVYLECELVLNSSNVLSAISASYSIDNNSMYINPVISYGSEWEAYYNDNDGFTLISDSGVSGTNKVLGKIRYSINDDVISGDEYVVKLVNVQLGYKDLSEGKIETLTSNVKVLDSLPPVEEEKSDVNTLSNIIINNGDIELNPIFSKDVFSYNVITDLEKVIIDASKSDDKSSVSGLGEKSLNIGNNEVKITVTSESGKVLEYIINITREEKNIEEEKSDVNTLSNIIINNGDVELNPSFSKDVFSYSVITDLEKVIIDASKSDDKSSVSGLGEKSLNIGNNEVKITVTSESGKVLEYIINIIREEAYSLTFADSLSSNVDNNLKFIKYIPSKMTVSDLKKQINVLQGEVNLYNSNNVLKSNDSVLATGDIVKVVSKGQLKAEYIVSVMGDSSGDGLVNVLDLVQLRKHYVGFVEPETGEVYVRTGVYFYALDMNKNGTVDLVDLVKIRKQIVGFVDEAE